VQIRVIAVGRLKENYLTEAVAEYRRRLLPYCKLTIEEVKDEPLPEVFSGPGVTQALAREGEKILRLLDQGPQTYVIAMDVSGQEVTSEGLAFRLAEIAV
jgi:23S rRNA (pseudouridine1915-N3)-methyltransferase